jgi:biopolymer transport protein ExbD
MATFLDMSVENQDAYMKNLDNPRVGIPTDSLIIKDASGGIISIDNEFKRWISHATQIRDDARAGTDSPELQLAIKADKVTNYPVVKKVMDDLRSLRKNKYLLITNLKTASSEK